ncbi:hypothetical protein [Oleispirillum naphthae]|uniref:hypothetical protein n=1 Tax=Oleispirillum naphthae TaxID=2838853 RepID=UPI0030822D45
MRNPARFRRSVGTRLTLESTAAAHAFYHAQDFRDDGAPQPCCGVLAQPMAEVLG